MRIKVPLLYKLLEPLARFNSCPVVDNVAFLLHKWVAPRHKHACLVMRYSCTDCANTHEHDVRARAVPIESLRVVKNDKEMIALRSGRHEKRGPLRGLPAGHRMV